MNNKRGISLIVLVITIIVMIILASTIILALSGNGVIFKTNKAKFQNDIATMKEELSVYISNKEAETNGAYNSDNLNANKNSLIEDSETEEGKTILDIIKSMDKKYMDKIEIVNGKLRYTGSNLNEIKWSDEVLEGIKGNNLAEVKIEQSNTIELEDSVNTSLANYRIYGNSIKNETSPLVEGVGDKKGKVVYIPELEESITSEYYVRYENGVGGYKTDIILEPNTTYYVSFDYVINSATEVLGTGIGYGDTNYKKDISSLVVWDSQEKNEKATMRFSFTTPEFFMSQYGTPYLWIRFTRVREKSSYNVELSNIYVSDNIYNSTECHNIQYTVSGINVANINKLIRGDTFVDNGDGTYKLEWTSNNRLSYKMPVDIPNGAEVEIRADIIETNSKYERIPLMMTYQNGEYAYYTLYDNQTLRFTAAKNINEIGMYIHTDDSIGTYVKLKDLIITINKPIEKYVPYVEPKTYNIYLDEPLRKIGNYADYIDFRAQEVVRNVEVIDDTGTLPLEQSLRGLDTPVREKITIPDVMLNEGTNIVEVLTKVQPSKIEALYYKK